VTYHPFTEGEVVCNIFWPKSDCQTVTSNGIEVFLLYGESKIYVPQGSLTAVEDM
jgi:alpha-amylase